MGPTFTCRSRPGLQFISWAFWNLAAKTGMLLSLLIPFMNSQGEAVSFHHEQLLQGLLSVPSQEEASLPPRTEVVTGPAGAVLRSVAEETSVGNQEAPMRPGEKVPGAAREGPSERRFSRGGSRDTREDRTLLESLASLLPGPAKAFEASKDLPESPAPLQTVHLRPSDITLPSDPGSCTCYEKGTELIGPHWIEVSCVCQLACVFGNEVVLFSNTSCAAQPQTPNTEGGLRHISCDRHSLGMNRVQEALRNHSVSIASLEWFNSRRRIEWLSGSTLFSVLDHEDLNVYCLVRDTYPWAALAKLLTESAGPRRRITRMVVKRDKLFQAAMHQSGRAGAHSVLVRAMLKSLLAAAVQWNLTTDSLLARELTSDSVASLPGGPILFEGHPLVARASPEEPLCMDTMVLPGGTPSLLHTGSKAEAVAFKRAVRDVLLLPSDFRASPTPTPSWLASSSSSSSPSFVPNLLYIQRAANRKRSFEKEAEEQFQALLNATGLPTKTLKFEKLSMVEQFCAVEWADIIIGLHGANLLNPSLFMRPGSVLIELFPWHFIRRGYADSTMLLGGVYMVYMLDRFTQPYSNYTHRECFQVLECRILHRDVYPMPLSVFDRMVIGELLERAKRIAVDVWKACGEQAHESGEVVLSQEVMGPHVAPCRPPDPDKRTLWIGFMANEEPRELELCELHI
eukprot:TRINITY_DN2425_c0_g1_i6.p1 TRINITY_DN2425_c0_g1~~TRINITY_DN2425_c0_g1_i6.p1  ORF type:complete len:683 (+),score=108.78 TRINITY_DN2425_c0_g1_i6:214-2262(+)